MSFYKSDEFGLLTNKNEINSSSRESPKAENWVEKFAYFFMNNVCDLQDLERISQEFQNRIIKRDFDFLPSVVFTDLFFGKVLSILTTGNNQSCSFALDIMYSFYIADIKFDIEPIHTLFDVLQKIFDGVECETKDQILQLCAKAVLHSIEARNYIYGLFPIEMLRNLYESNNDFSQSIAKLIYGYSCFNFSDVQWIVNLLEFSKILCNNAIIMKGKLHRRVLDQDVFFYCLVAIHNISTFFADFASVMCNGNDPRLDLMLDELLRDENNAIPYIFKVILDLYHRPRTDLCLDHEGLTDVILPNISYSTISSYIKMPTNSDLSKLEIVILAERVLMVQIKFCQDQRILKDIYDKKLISRLKGLITDSPFDLKVASIKTLKQIIKYADINIIQQIIENNIEFDLLDELEPETPILQLSIIRCLHILIQKMIIFNINPEELITSISENANIFEVGNEKIDTEISQIIKMI